MEIAPLEAPFGAAVNVGDPQHLVGPDGADELSAALHRHGVLLIRNDSLDERQLVELGNQLGPLDRVFPADHRLNGNQYIRLQSNVPGLGANGGGEYWHADGPWKPDPGATLLRCADASPGSGPTLFADMRLAWDTLPEAERQHIQGLAGWFPIRQAYLDECLAAGTPVDQGRLAALQDLQHPLVRGHPVTGREALYLNQAGLASVLGLDSTDSAALLSRLYEHATDGRFLYRHEWQPGDVLVWDNACVMHKAQRSTTATRKITQRVTTDGFHARARAHD